MNTTNKAEIKKLLSKFTPEQRGMLEHYTELKIQNQIYEKQLSELKSAYDDMYKVMIVLLHVDKDHELRMHKSHFLRFKDEYRIDTYTDPKTEEFVMKLKALAEEI